MPQMISMKEAATVIGSSPSMVKRLVTRNVLHAQKVGPVYLISREEIDSKLPLIREKYRFGWKHHAGRGQYLTLRQDWGLKVTKRQIASAKSAQRKSAKAAKKANGHAFPVEAPSVNHEDLIEALKATTSEVMELREVVSAFLHWCKANWSPSTNLQ